MPSSAVVTRDYCALRKDISSIHDILCMQNAADCDAQKYDCFFVIVIDFFVIDSQRGRSEIVMLRSVIDSL